MEAPRNVIPILHEDVQVEFSKTPLGTLSINLFWRIINHLPDKNDRISLRKTCRDLYKLSKTRVIAIHIFNKSFIDPAGMEEYGFSPCVRIMHKGKILFQTAIPQIRKTQVREEHSLILESSLFGFTDPGSVRESELEMFLSYEFEPINRVRNHGEAVEITNRNKLFLNNERVNSIWFIVHGRAIYDFPATPLVKFEAFPY